MISTITEIVKGKTKTTDNNDKVYNENTIRNSLDDINFVDTIDYIRSNYAVEKKINCIKQLNSKVDKVIKSKLK